MLSLLFTEKETYKRLRDRAKILSMNRLGCVSDLMGDDRKIKYIFFYLYTS